MTVTKPCQHPVAASRGDGRDGARGRDRVVRASGGDAPDGIDSVGMAVRDPFVTGTPDGGGFGPPASGARLCRRAAPRAFPGDWGIGGARCRDGVTLR